MKDSWAQNAKVRELVDGIAIEMHSLANRIIAGSGHIDPKYAESNAALKKAAIDYANVRIRESLDGKEWRNDISLYTDLRNAFENANASKASFADFALAIDQKIEQEITAYQSKERYV